MKTPLYDRHVSAGADMVSYAGYAMPVQYPQGVLAEHTAVRTAAGLFDVSHMGEFLLAGAGALATLQNLLTNDMEGMADLSCRYSPMCDEDGFVVDDLIVYRRGEGRYMLVVNAACHAKDAQWIAERLAPDTTFADVSEQTALIALQGPASIDIIAKLTDVTLLPKGYYTFAEALDVAGVTCAVSRTGYTGEDGFELYCPTCDAVTLWDALCVAGESHGLALCGLGARDTLRLEAGMPLYGHEMGPDITAIEAGLSMFVKRDKSAFLGKEALSKKPLRRRSGLRVTGRGIAREGCPVFIGEREIGVVTSGTMLPHVGYAGAMALLAADSREIGTQVEVDIRGRRVAAEVVKLPFYRRP